MSHFYGTLEGNRGTASRCGSKKSGMATNCASWEGRVSCHAYHNHKTKTDWVRVTLDTWQGRGQYPPVVLYHGPIGKHKPKEE